jgi:predicted  nucleic acid-binding Zn-ribbon protein
VNSGLQNLIALQDAEQKIASLFKQICNVPTTVQKLEEELQRLVCTHQERVARLSELGKRRRTLEGEVDMMRTKLARLRDQLMAVKTNKEYTAMLHEIQGAESQIRAEEDKILEIMEEMEAMEGNLKGAEKELDFRQVEIRKEIAQCRDSVPGLETELGRLRLQKELTESMIESELLSRYRRIAEVRRGIGLAEARDELCTACHVRIRPQVYAELLQTEIIHSCDSCSRILFLRSPG